MIIANAKEAEEIRIKARAEEYTKLSSSSLLLLLSLSSSLLLLLLD